jgi:hypothetical protein
VTHRSILLAGTGALALVLAGCKSCKKSEPKAAPPVASASADAGVPKKKRIPGPTEPDPDWEKRRDELLRRGDPEKMKPAPVLDQSKPVEINASDLIKAVSKDLMMVRDIKVDLAAGTAEIPGQVALESGLLEFVAVSLGGKAYESLFTVNANAVELRLAMTLLGYEGTPPGPDGTWPAATDKDTVTVTVKVGGKDRPLTDFMIDRKTGKPPKTLPGWQVVGFSDAERSSSLTTLQLLTLVDREIWAPLRIVAGGDANPYAGPKAGFAPNGDALPPIGTEITLVIHRGAAATKQAP